MIKRAFQKSVLLAAIAGMLTSCSTDIDLLEDYKPITIVYGLLNVHDSIQYIKINKAFLGEGNALVMAQQSDSINYKPGELVVQLQQINSVTGEVLQTFTCDTTTQILKDDGVFSNPYQLLYQTAAPLDENSNYKLLINRLVDGAVISAVTPVVNNVQVTNPDPLSPSAVVRFYNGLSQNFVAYHLRWKQSADAEIYSASIRFTYYDSLMVSPFTKDTVTIEMNIGEELAGSTAIGSAKELVIEGEQFYNFIDASVPPNANAMRWAEEYVEIFLTAGAGDLHTYIEVNKPSIGLIQEKPVFSNVSNGTGIFSSRWGIKLRNKMDAASTIKANEFLH